MGSGKALKNAIKKYGIDNFSKEILHVFKTEEEMNAKEKELVVISEQSYNLCEGGKGGFSYINNNGLRRKFTFEEIKKGGKATKRRLLEYKQKIGIVAFNLERKKLSERASAARRIKYPNGIRWTQSEQAKKNQKEALQRNAHQAGIKNSQFGSFWITNGIINKKSKGVIPEGFYKGRI